MSDGEIFKHADERFKSPRDAVRFWRASVDASEKEEKNWTLKAEKAAEIYAQNRRDRQAFNILHANAQTVVSAAYNSTPLPDVRTKFLDEDPVADAVGEIIERGISHQIDVGDFDGVITQAITQAYVPGRGVVRVRYEPHMHQDSDQGEMVAFEECPSEVVQWQDFRRGPGKAWKDVPWVAFRQEMTRADVMGLLVTDDASEEKAEAIVDQISFDLKPASRKDDRDSEEKDVLGRAEVWEIWDKAARLVWFVCMTYEGGPLAVEPDPFELVEFFPVPKPLVYTSGLDTLTPICPYSLYETQAEELEKTSNRIRTLTECLKWRGIRASEIEELEDLPHKEDGVFIPSQGAMALLMQGKGLADAIWTMPLESLVVVVRELVQIREQQKMVIYEITGIADIMRGQTNAGETLGAQQLKTQWGSLRVQAFQREVQRFVRDLFRIKAHIIGNIFNEQTLTTLNGKPVDPQIMAAMKNDQLRRMRVDVETDSTIRGDLTRIQTEQTNFLNATGQFISAVGPVIQTPVNPAGFLPPQVAIEIFQSFARSYRLGRQVEDVLAQLSQAAKQAEGQVQEKDPAETAAREAETVAREAEARKAAADAAKAEAEAMKLQAETAQIAQGEPEHGPTPMDQHGAAMAERKLALEEARLALEAQKLAAEVACKDADREAKTSEALVQAGFPPDYRYDEDREEKMAAMIQMQADRSAQMQAEQSAQIAEALQMLAAAMGAPKRVIRDNTGKAVGVETIIN